MTSIYYTHAILVTLYNYKRGIQAN